MVNKQQVVGSIFRGLVSGGSWVRIVYWAKKDIGRKIKIELEYSPNDIADWTLTLLNSDKTTRFEGKGTTLEAVTIDAMSALGKEGLGG
jgi:hypothetical protein